MENRLAELCHSMQATALHRRHRVTVICRDNPELPLDSSGVCLYLLEECGEWRVDWRSHVTQCRQQRYTVDIDELHCGRDQDESPGTKLVAINQKHGAVVFAMNYMKDDSHCLLDLKLKVVRLKVIIRRAIIGHAKAE
ncbi:hypothetical protein J6590_081756 [Homalodisca vitripennis]|nr:hypothetical protein J6590_081756 [Homalodisca vitripennis]